MSSTVSTFPVSRPKGPSAGKTALALLLFVAFLWGVEIIDFVLRLATPFSLDGLGIVPRSIPGLIGIPMAPLLHGGFDHLAGNTLPLIVLGWLAAMASGRNFLRTIITIVLVAGVGTWLAGGLFNSDPTIHFGASSLVFGFLGYTLAHGIFHRSPKWILIGMVTALIYIGMLFSLLSWMEGVSWTSHAFGFLGGVFASKKNAEIKSTPALPAI